MKYLYLLACTLLLRIAPAAAAAGDTTWVKAHSNVMLNYFNNFDTTVKFPDGSTRYRKVIMEFTLGKYACAGYDPARPGDPPGGTGWCGDWDYTVQIKSMNKKGDSLELGRLITPYANSLYTRFPLTWKERYYFDVTDYYPALKDSNKIRIAYSGYSGGFTADVRFALVEGTPERDVVGINHIWDGSFTYGSPADPINNHTAGVPLTAPAGTAAAAFKFNVTGHGSDTITQCSEFCERYYRVVKDGSLVEQKSIWRDNCGSNNLYPQSGTWTLNRANWCPGALVQTNIHTLPGVAGGSKFTLNVEFQAHTTIPSKLGYPSYILNGTVVYYGNFNHSLDASLEALLAPTNYEGQFRENPRNGLTTVRIRNSGSTVINNIDFEFGVSGQPLTKATWTGTLASLRDTVIDLPLANSLLSSSGTDLPYEVNILKVNGSVDEDATNNRVTSTFNAAPEWPNKFTVALTTNKSVTTSSTSETEWRIYDMKSGAIAAERVNNAASTIYKDSLNLPTGVYKFVMSDAGCDGISYWLYRFYPTDPGIGSLTIKPGVFTTLNLNGYLKGDFGCGFTQYFRIGTPTAIQEIDPQTYAEMEVFPNPANSMVTVRINTTGKPDGLLQLLDNTGRVVFHTQMSSNQVQIPAGHLAAGLYYVSFMPAGNSGARLQSKLMLVR